MSTIIQLTVCFFNPQNTDVDYYTVDSMFFNPRNTDVDYYTVNSMFF